MSEETKAISARIPIELYEIMESKLIYAKKKGKRVPLKTKGRFRDMRMSDVIVDMLADAVIKEEQKEQPSPAFYDRLDRAIKDGAEFRIRVLDNLDLETIRIVSERNGTREHQSSFRKDIADENYYLFFYVRYTDRGESMKYHVTNTFNDECFMNHRLKELERD
jgi:hypothetical protein